MRTTAVSIIACLLTVLTAGCQRVLHAPERAFLSAPLSPVCELHIPEQGGSFSGNGCVLSPTTLLLTAHQVPTPSGEIRVDGFWTRYQLAEWRPGDDIAVLHLHDALPGEYPPVRVDLDTPLPAGTPVVVLASVPDEGRTVMRGRWVGEPVFVDGRLAEPATLAFTTEQASKPVRIHGTVVEQRGRALRLKPTDPSNAFRPGVSGSPALALTPDGWAVVGVASKGILLPPGFARVGFGGLVVDTVAR